MPPFAIPPRTLLRCALTFCMACVATACAGSGFVLDHQPTSRHAGAAAFSALRVRANDLRRAVVGGESPACYLGTSGNDFVPVPIENGPDCTALAGALARDVGEALRARGIDTQTMAGGSLELSVTEWEYDGWDTGHAWYAVEAQLLDASGAQVAKTTLQSDGPLTDAGRGSIRQAQQRLPALYDGLVEAVLAFALEAPAP